MKKTAYKLALVAALLMGSLQALAAVEEDFNSVAKDTHEAELWLRNKLHKEAGVRFTEESHDGTFYDSPSKLAANKKQIPKYRKLPELREEDEMNRIAEELKEVRY